MAPKKAVEADAAAPVDEVVNKLGPENVLKEFR